jgi:hypothetical protein
MISDEKTSFGSNNSSLSAERGMSIFRYLKRFNLFNEPDLLILYPNIHFYYDENELKSVRTFINLKKLNLIKDLDAFLHSVFSITPMNINFVGCFSDSKPHKGIEFITGLSTRLTNLLDAKTYNSMDKAEVTKLLEKYGYKVVDMTESNGITFFYSRNVHQPVETKTNLDKLA